MKEIDYCFAHPQLL